MNRAVLIEVVVPMDVVSVADVIGVVEAVEAEEAKEVTRAPTPPQGRSVDRKSHKPSRAIASLSCVVSPPR